MAGFGEMIKPMAKQAEFDAFVQSILDEGTQLDEAVAEALSTLEEDQDISGLFVYRDENEKQNKQKFEANCRCVERTSTGQETPVNCIFAFQGMRQALSGGSNSSMGSWRMLESRGLVHTLLKQLTVVADEEDGEGEGTQKMDAVEDSDDGEDEDEDKIVFTTNVLDMLLLIGTDGTQMNRLRSAEAAFTCSEEEMAVILKRLDEDSAEFRVTSRMVALLAIVLSQPQNKEFFLAASGPDLLEMCAKMHKKKTDLCAQIATLNGSLTGMAP